MTAKGVLIDTGPLVAVLSKQDQHHVACIEAAKTLRGSFYTVWPAVTEAAYLLRDNPMAVQKLLGRIKAYKLRLFELAADDVDGVLHILSRYRDQDFDLTDAVLMHVAQREGLDTIFTVDRRHFSVFRTADGRAFKLPPDIPSVS